MPADVSAPTTPFATYGTRPAAARAERPPLRHQKLRDRLDCRFDAVDDVFDECIDEAQRKLSATGLDAYLAQASTTGQTRSWGRAAAGVPRNLADAWPAWPARPRSRLWIRAIQAFQKSPNGPAIVPLLQSLGAVARRLPSPELLAQYLERGGPADAAHQHLDSRATTPLSPAPACRPFCGRRRRWSAWCRSTACGAGCPRAFACTASIPQRQIDFFALATPDSRALLQRERHGTLLVDVERRLELTLRCLWNEHVALIPYPVSTDGNGEAAAITLPYAQPDGFRLPEVLDDWQGSRRGSSAQRAASVIAPSLPTWRRIGAGASPRWPTT